MKKWILNLLLLLLAAHSSYAQKTIITKASDLPSQQYPVPGTALELFQNEKAFAAFMTQVETNVKNTLEKYEFADKSIERKYLLMLGDIYFLKENYSQALQLHLRAREAQLNPRAKLTSSLQKVATLRALIDTKGKMDEPMKKAFAKYLEESVDKLSWANILPWVLMPEDWMLVQEDIKNLKSVAETRSKKSIRAMIQTYVEPTVKKNQAIGNEQADALIWFKTLEKYDLFTDKETVTVLTKHTW